MQLTFVYPNKMLMSSLGLLMELLSLVPHMIINCVRSFCRLIYSQQNGNAPIF